MERRRACGRFAHLGFEEFQQLLGSANGLRLGVVVGTQFPQRGVELGGEKQHEQAGKEGDLYPIATKVQMVDIREAKVDGNQRH